jgi:hypothetical protein
LNFSSRFRHLREVRDYVEEVERGGGRDEEARFFLDQASEFLRTVEALPEADGLAEPPGTRDEAHSPLNYSFEPWTPCRARVCVVILLCLSSAGGRVRRIVF